MPSFPLLPLLRAGLIALCASAAAGGSVQAAGPAAPPPPDLGGLQALPAPQQANAPTAGAGAGAGAGASSSDPARRVTTIRPTAATTAAAGPSAGAASSPQAVVIEDRFTRIEELHERGEVRRIQVQPRGGAAYEILPATGGRDISSGAQGGRGAAGQRVWPLLSF